MKELKSRTGASERIVAAAQQQVSKPDEKSSVLCSKKRATGDGRVWVSLSVGRRDACDAPEAPSDRSIAKPFFICTLNFIALMLSRRAV